MSSKWIVLTAFEQAAKDVAADIRARGKADAKRYAQSSLTVAAHTAPLLTPRSQWYIAAIAAAFGR